LAPRRADASVKLIENLLTAGVVKWPNKRTAKHAL
jgi:hypothetical protein